MKTESGTSINEFEAVKIKVINTKKFEISEDARNYSKYEGSGIAKQVKVPITMKFKSLEEIEKEEDNWSAYLDQTLIYSDFTKMENINILHHITQVALNNPSVNK